MIHALISRLTLFMSDLQLYQSLSTIGLLGFISAGITWVDKTSWLQFSACFSFAFKLTVFPFKLAVFAHMFMQLNYSSVYVKSLTMWPDLTSFSKCFSRLHNRDTVSNWLSWFVINTLANIWQTLKLFSELWESRGYNVRYNNYACKCFCKPLRDRKKLSYTPNDFLCVYYCYTVLC